MSGDVVLLERPPYRPATTRKSSAPHAAPAELAPTVVEAPTWRQFAADLIELTKPRIVLMILITTGVAAIVGAQGAVAWSLALHLLLGTALVAASAGVLNQYLEREVDRRMTRTARRPLPAGRMRPGFALAYGLTIGLVGTLYLGWQVSWVTAALGVVTWFSYLVLYTPLKQRTSFNTTVGAVAGALPMLMGYTGGGGELTDAAGWLLLGVLVAWQYPHFMAIAWLYRKQYGEAGFQMTPVTDPSGVSAGWQSIVGAIVLPVFLIALVSSNTYWPVWSIGICLVSWGLIQGAWGFSREPNEQTARRMLRASLSQLPLAMLMLVLATFFGG